MPRYIVIVKYTDSYNRTGTARLKVKASDPGRARKKAEKELKEIEKFSTSRNFRKFDLKSIQIVQQSDPQRVEGLLISRSNFKTDLEVWEIRGAIDSNTNKQFDDLLEEAQMEGTKKIVINCKGLEYINSTGIGSIVNAHSQMELKLAEVPQKITEILMVVGLDELLKIYYSVEEALEDF